MDPLDIKAYLPLVRKPGRYIGTEVNSIRKDLSRVRCKFGLGFPDVYEVGMSHLGLQVLYGILNSREDIACERVFAPWLDMEALLRDKGVKLSTLESDIPLDKLDIMGFSLQYELSYTNVLNMLELGGIPLLSSSRGERDPFVIGGGPAAYNPEPTADFFDAFLLGDGEEAVLEIADEIMEGKAKGEDRASILKRLAQIDGVYVPSFFDIRYNPDGTVKEAFPLLEGYKSVRKRIVMDIDAAMPSTRPVIPFIETIHDRVTVEIARGCTRGCRFCQAGMTYRPLRERKPSTIAGYIKKALKNTGYDEVSLLSLSTGDYTMIEDLLAGLMNGFVEQNVAVSLPSLRVGTLSPALATEIRKVRKTGFTMAPEAGSERLRDFINKGIREEDLISSAREVFSLGWGSLKLYFMIGLPTETDEDIIEITRLAEKVRGAGRRATGARSPQINVSVSSFIPKPFTPFQWEPQIKLEECVRRQTLLKKRLSALHLGFKWHDADMSVMEGVFARGDRRLSRVILNAFKKGCRMDGWSDQFKFGLWQEAFREEGLETGFYTERERAFEEVFPWDHLAPGLTKEFLWREREAAFSLSSTPDCKTGRCSACGVCDHKIIKNIVTKEAAPAGKGAPAPGVERAPRRIRVRFSKTGPARFLSHLELVSAVTRAVRRAGLPLAYSQGFHRMPKMVFSRPLPLGIESLDETLDIELEAVAGRTGPEEILEGLNSEAPQGIKFMEAVELSLKLSRSSDIMNAVEYLVFLKNGPSGMDIEPERIDGFLREFHEKDSVVMRVRKEDKVREVDIKPLVSGISLVGDMTLKLVLRTAEGRSVRPHDVISRLFNLSAEDASLIPVLKTKAVL